MNNHFIWFTIIVLLPIIAMCGVNLFIDHFYQWWVTYQQNKYIRRAHKSYEKGKHDRT